MDRETLADRLLREADILTGHTVEADLAANDLEMDICQMMRDMAELPVSKDGRHVHVGDTVYGEDGTPWCVTSIILESSHPSRAMHSVLASRLDDRSIKRALSPEWLTYERPACHAAAQHPEE